MMNVTLVYKKINMLTMSDDQKTMFTNLQETQAFKEC